MPWNNLMLSKPTAFLVLCLVVACTPPILAEEGGYVVPLSAAQGDTLRFYFSSEKEEFNLRIYRFEKTRVLVKSVEEVKGKRQSVGDSAFFYGCDWKPGYTLAVPHDWPSGVYEAEFAGESGARNITFVVRERESSAHSKIVVSLAASTWQAYNNFGCRSLYNFNSLDSTASHRVSFERPLATSSGATEDQSYRRF